MQLPNRATLESDAAERLTRLATRQRRQLDEMIVMPPVAINDFSFTAWPVVDFSRITPHFWQDAESEADDELEIIALLLFTASAEFHAEQAGAAIDARGRLADANLQRRLAADAESYAERHAREAAKHWATGARKQFDAARQRIAAKIMTARQQDSQRIANRPSILRPIARHNALAERAKQSQADLEAIADDLAKELAKVLGPVKAERFAVDETTAAQSAGGDAAVMATIGTSLDDLWINRPDKSQSGPCPICRPLHLIPRREWPVDYFDGPGPWVHPGCVCEIRYANMMRKRERPRPRRPYATQDGERPFI